MLSLSVEDKKPDPTHCIQGRLYPTRAAQLRKDLVKRNKLGRLATIIGRSERYDRCTSGTGSHSRIHMLKAIESGRMEDSIALRNPCGASAYTREGPHSTRTPPRTIPRHRRSRIKGAISCARRNIHHQDMRGRTSIDRTRRGAPNILVIRVKGRIGLSTNSMSATK